MFFLSLCQWLQNTNWATAIRQSSWVYPIILASHLTGIALFGGMLLVSDLRLLGFALTKVPISQVVGRLRPWKRVGLIWMVTFGFLLFAAKAARYYINPYFDAKVILLLLTGVHAWIFRRSVYNRTAEFDGITELPGKAKAAAWISLALWLAIIIMGRMIGYYELPDEP
jgi:hypothetical protein